MESHCNDSESDDEKYEKYLWRTLDTLPPEIILHIFSFLSAKFVINVLSQVCKQFKDIIKCDTTWKMRIFHRWPKKYPIVPSILPDIDWKVACIDREEQYHLWSDHLENMRNFNIIDAHFGCVNVVQLIEEGRICVSGGRDGYLKLWNICPDYLSDKLYNNDLASVNTRTCLLNSSQHANAWLWDVTYDYYNKHLFSGGFDCNIKCWDLEYPSVPFMTYGLSSPVLCLAHHEDLLGAGSFGRNVNIFDLRVERSVPILSHNQHKKSVLCIAVDEKYVITGAEDKSIIVYDISAAKILKRLEFDSFPLSMSYGEGQLFVGDVSNFLHVIDPAHGEFNLLHTMPSGHIQKVTGIQHSLGSIITCSTDKTIRILEPNLDPVPIAVLEATNEVARISWHKNILASANVDDTISVWLPDELFT